MTEDRLEQQLVDYLGDAHAFELDVEHVLGALIAAEQDERVAEDLRRHRAQSHHHVLLLEGRLEAYGHRPSVRKDVRSLGAAYAKELTERFRGDRQARIARDAYAIAQLEIATCQLLERLARRVGDDETARVIGTIREQELAMVARIDATWDVIVDRLPGGGAEAAGRRRR